MQKFGLGARAAFAHECVALNLRDVDVESVPRGTTVCQPGLYRAVSVFLGTLENIDDAKSIGRRAKVKLHVGTSVANASLALINTEKLTPGQQANSILRWWMWFGISRTCVPVFNHRHTIWRKPRSSTKSDHYPFAHFFHLIEE